MVTVDVLWVGPFAVSMVFWLALTVSISPPARIDTNPCRMVAPSSATCEPAAASTVPSIILPSESTPALSIVVFSIVKPPVPVASMSPVLTTAFVGTVLPLAALSLSITSAFVAVASMTPDVSLMSVNSAS